MKDRVLGIIGAAAILLAGLPSAVLAAGEAEVLQDISTSIRFTDPVTGEGVRGLAECDVLVRLEAEDGSASEWQACALSEDQPMGPVTPPATAVTESGGECIWSSDHWGTKDGSLVAAASYELTVTPTGRVYVWTTYPAEPLACPAG